MQTEQVKKKELPAIVRARELAAEARFAPAEEQSELQQQARAILQKDYTHAVKKGDVATAARLANAMRSAFDQRSPETIAAADIAAVAAYPMSLQSFVAKLEHTREDRAWSEILESATQWSIETCRRARASRQSNNAVVGELGRLREFGIAVDEDLAQLRDDDSTKLAALKQKLLADFAMLPISDCAALPIRKNRKVVK